MKVAVDRTFGSFEKFRAAFETACKGVRGSGWGWLGMNPLTGDIAIASTYNQDTLLSTHGLIPLLGVDVWEHAYYPQYQNRRADYLQSIWYVINWGDVNARYSDAMAAHNISTPVA